MDYNVERSTLFIANGNISEIGAVQAKVLFMIQSLHRLDLATRKS